MDEEDIKLPEPEPKKKKKDKKRRLENEPPPQMNPLELENAHKKFLMIMFGLFFAVLLLMIIMNSHFDFSLDGGI
ncbi:MAG: hypothetical protein HQM08_21355 [Candidatus Riflebacteria bacterium]|nr:hypothetical protein [Candidatus Riflebacteria bacterium]